MPWNIQSRVENRQDHESKCLQFNFGINLSSENTFTRQPCEQKSKSFICEHHTYADVCSKDNNNHKAVPNDLFIENEARFTWHAARSECRNRGAGWDLVIIESQSKLDLITNLTDCGTTYWTGQTDRNGYIVGVNGEHIKFANWDTHQNMLNPGSNDAIGNESCIRLRGDKINDVDCDKLSKVRIYGRSECRLIGSQLKLWQQ